MASTSTPNIGLLKATPNTQEPFRVEDVNNNWDKIDNKATSTDTDLKSRPVKLPMVPVRRDFADALGSGDTLMETYTMNLKAGRWYEAVFSFNYHTSLAVNTTPNPRVFFVLKAGPSISASDPKICTGDVPNITTCNPRMTFATPFDVPSDGQYTIGVAGNSGGSNTLYIPATGGTGNNGINRVFYVKDLGEK